MSLVNSLPLSERRTSGVPCSSINFSKMALATVVASLSGIAFAMGQPSEMIHHHQYILVVAGGRQFHNQVSRYLGKNSPWYLHGLQLILVSWHLLPLTQGTAVYMGLYVFYHFRPVVVSFDEGISFPMPI